MKETNSSGNKTLPKKLIVFSILLALLLFSKFLLPKFQHNNQPQGQPLVTSTIQQDLANEEIPAIEETVPQSVPDLTVPETDSNNCTQEFEEDTSSSLNTPNNSLNEDGIYTSKEDVALYIHLYKHLPDNFITKKEAQGVNLKAENKCIGGDRFHNREGILPKAKGRTYTECDIDTLGKSSRGAKRIVFSNDGLVYYTGDHYQTFVLLYGEEK
ncbi:MAG: hypothetical protein II103_09810 [Treponema sp.]|nr:hypothetical protein [Treponema sp.]